MDFFFFYMSRSQASKKKTIALPCPFWFMLTNVVIAGSKLGKTQLWLYRSIQEKY